MMRHTGVLFSLLKIITSVFTTGAISHFMRSIASLFDVADNSLAGDPKQIAVCVCPRTGR